jgi:hypothetical protein
MPTNPFDQACRYLAHLDPVGLLCWLLKLSVTAFAFERWLNTRTIPFPGEPERTCDTVAFLRDLGRGGIPWAVVVEFQIEPDSLMFGRMLVYNGRVWMEIKPSPEVGDRFQMGAIVVNLTGKGVSGRTMAWPEAGLGLSLKKPDRNLCEYNAATVLRAIAAGRVAKVVLPFIPLMQRGAEDGIIRQWVKIASAETDDRLRSDYGALALIFAEAANASDVWKKALEGWSMIQSKQVLEWQAQALARMLTKQLEERFGALPEELSKAIRGTADETVLLRWGELVVRVDSLDEFRRGAGL